MMPKQSLLLPTLLLALLLGGCGGESQDVGQERSAPGDGERTAQEPAPTPNLGPDLTWKDLRPADWQPMTPFAPDDVDDIADDDPRALALFEALRKTWEKAPVVQALDGRSVRLSGLVVPLTTVDGMIREFLLVPYFGACIHVPPPPPNQTVRVVTGPDGGYRGELFDTVWVQGTLEVERFRSEHGEAGYRIDAVSVSPYPESG